MIAVCGIGSPSGLLEQRHHGVPVGEAADGGGLRERGDEAERRMHVQQRLRRRRTAPACAASTSVASALTRRNSAARAASPGASNDEGGGKAHDGFRTDSRS